MSHPPGLFEHMLAREPSPKLRDKRKPQQPPKPAPFGHREEGPLHVQKTHLMNRLRLELTKYPADQTGQLTSTVPAKRGLDLSHKLDAGRCGSASCCHEPLPVLARASSSRELHCAGRSDTVVEGGPLEMIFGSQGQWFAFSSCPQPARKTLILFQRAQETNRHVSGTPKIDF